MKRRNFLSHYLLIDIILLLILPFCLLLTSPSRVLPQEIIKTPVRKIEEYAREMSKLTKPFPLNPHLGKRTPMIISGDPGDEIWMEFALDWTNCQIHRVNDNSPLEIILNGNINSNSPEIWILTTNQPIPGTSPNLHFVEDIFGQTYGAGWINIALNWELSLDGGAFVPMIILPDNSISYNFPPGNHAFQVRISGMIPYHQDDGYYQLQLVQSLVPQL